MGQARPSDSVTVATRLKRLRRSRWVPWARRSLTMVLVGLAAWTAYEHRSELTAGARMLTTLHIGWLLVAIAAELASMVAFAGLQRWLLRAGGVAVGAVSILEITLAGNAMSTSLPGGAAWASVWAFGQLRRRGANRELAAWVILVAGALASFAIFVIVATGAWVAGNRGPVAHLRWVAAALAAVPLLLVIGVAAATRSRLFREALLRGWASVARHSSAVGAAGRLVRHTIDNLGLVRPEPAGWLEAFGFALTNWLLDALALALSIEALGLPVPWRGLLVIYGLTQIAASLPVTPGGLGVVEASMAALLVAYGSTPADAFAAVLLYRIISFWGFVPIGWSAWVSLALAERTGLRSRPHPWAFHFHGSRVPVSSAPVGPERLIRPQPCLGCGEPVAVVGDGPPEPPALLGRVPPLVNALRTGNAVLPSA